MQNEPMLHSIILTIMITRFVGFISFKLERICYIYLKIGVVICNNQNIYI